MVAKKSANVAFLRRGVVVLLFLHFSGLSSSKMEGCCPGAGGRGAVLSKAAAAVWFSHIACAAQICEKRIDLGVGDRKVPSPPRSSRAVGSGAVAPGCSLVSLLRCCTRTAGTESWNATFLCNPTTRNERVA